MQKINILNYGMYGAINVGDEMIAASFVQYTKERIPSSDITLLTMSPKKTIKFINNKLDYKTVKLIPFKLNFIIKVVKLIRTIRKNEVIIIGGGGLFQDQYSANLPSGALFIAGLGKLMNKKVYILGTGAGPIKRKWLSKIMKDILENVDLVSVRDHESMAFLKKLEVENSNVYRTGDLVPLYNFNSHVPFKIESERKILTFILRKWKGLNPEKLAELTSNLVRNSYTVHFLCYEKMSDELLAQEIISKVKCNNEFVKIISPTDIDDVLTSLQESSLVVSMRLHGCILSNSLRIPLIPVYYESKILEYSKLVNLDNVMISTENLSNDLLDFLLDYNSKYKNIKKKVEDSFEILKINSRKGYDLIFNDINNNESVKKIHKFQLFCNLYKLFVFTYASKIFKKINLSRK
jgi:polysaccharide pyruvyl transferase CsaB